MKSHFRLVTRQFAVSLYLQKARILKLGYEETVLPRITPTVSVKLICF